MDLPPASLHGGHVISSMCAAALPFKQENWRRITETDRSMLALFEARKKHGQKGERPETEELGGINPRGKSRAWDAFEYRANVPTLSQYDRDSGSRRSRSRYVDTQTNLVNLGPKPTERKKRPHTPQRVREKRHGQRDGSDDSGSKSEEVNKPPKRCDWKAVEKNLKDKAWLGRVRKDFMKKFYAPSTLATKNTKRKKVIEIMEGMTESGFPLTVDKLTNLAAILDSTGMKAGDQYLGEAKSLHIEAGYDWDVQLDRQMMACKRAMQRDKGPEVRAKEVKPDEIGETEWNRVNKSPKEPKRVAWSYMWACMWMLRAIEAANVRANDVVVKLEEKLVRLRIRKSKTDQKASGVWRTLKCCGKESCERDCPFSLAVAALNERGSNDGSSPLFPDENGAQISKFHLVTSWMNHLDKEMSGHSARRSGAMRYARRGLTVHAIQFLGRWKSSAVFRYIEEAMTELPMNVIPADQAGDNNKDRQEETRKRRALRPKSSAAPPRDNIAPEPVQRQKPLIDEEEKETVYALSRYRGKTTKHVVGQAAWGIPLDSWTTICGWNFAKRNVKVELTKNPCKRAQQCKKCQKLESERDGVKGAREWAHQMKL